MNNQRKMGRYTFIVKICGGGTQYELLENININIFNNSRPL
jgi:hypothetical protein